MTKTDRQYAEIVRECRDIFTGKMKDYGTAWRVLRVSSLTDQIYIKARRIRSIEERGGVRRIDEDRRIEYVGIINYSIMALIQLDFEGKDDIKLEQGEIIDLYDKWFGFVKNLMDNKNHDYDEAWRKMRISSLTDIVLMKLQRIKQIEDNQGKTQMSEGLDANYADIINYSVFALIKLNEHQNSDEDNYKVK